MSVSVVILAAGAGTRMKSNLPKSVLHKICGKPMLFYSIDEALNLSDDVHIVLFHQESLVKEKIIESYPKAYESGALHFHIQDYENYPGTGGAIMQGGSGEKAKHCFAYKYEEYSYP